MSSCRMSETHGRLTGIRTHGRLGVQHQGGGILSAPLTNDLAELLLVALKSRVIRRDVLPLLSQEEAEALKFVERARELRVLSKTYHQERALRLAAMLYKTHFMGGNSRKFDGIGQHDRTAMTAALWERARKNTDQLRSYEVLEEVLEAASQRGSMLGLSLLPRLVTTLNFDDLLEEMGDSEQELPMVRALESIREIRHQGPEEWLLMFRSVVDKLKAAVVLSDMSIPGGPMICVNSTFCTITGYARQEAEGRNCRFLQGPATQLESLRVIQRTLASAADCQVAIYNYRKNGQIFLNLLSMRPVLDIDGKYTYVVAVQFEVNETCVLSQQRKLRMLDDLLALMPKAVPFKRLRIRDRPVPPVTSLRVSYDEEDERAVIWRCTFFATRLKWLTSPVAAITWLLSIVKLRHHLRELAASVDLGSAATLFAFEQAVAQKKGSPEWESHVDVLAKTFLPKVMLHPKSVELVAIIRQVEKDEKEEPAISNLLCAPSDTLDQGNPACSQEERLAKGFLHGITNAARDAPVSCIVVDVMTPGLPIVFANSRFLRLAGVSSENDVLGKNCRFLQGDVSQTTQRYLMEEIANSIRERQGVMVKMYNYARGKVFQNLIVLHPVFSTAGGEYLYQIGAQVNMSENGESVEANLANLERFVALLPETVDITSETDRATLLLSTTTIKDVHTCRVGDRPADDALEAKSSSITELPTIEEQQRQKQQQQQQQTKQAPEGNQGGGGSGGVGWHDMPQASCDPKLRLEIESECLQAIVKMTSAKWLDVPEQTTAALFRQKGLCHDAFTAFAAKRSRVAKALVRCWDIIEEILTEPVLADQKQLALKYHAVWQENPLFLFAKTEIPVGALSKLDFNWDPILQQLPHTQARCERVLSVHVLPDFLSSTDGQEMIRKLLGHPDSSLAYLKDPHAYMDENPADGEAFKLPPVPEVHPDLYTAAQHPSTGVPVLAVKAGCADKSSFWLEMISNLIGDDDSSSLREKERLQSLDGAVVDTRDVGRMYSPETSAWLASLASAFGEVVVEEVRTALEATPKTAPKTFEIAHSRSIIFIQPIFSGNEEPRFRLVFSIDKTGDERYARSLSALTRFLQHAPLTMTGQAWKEGDNAAIRELNTFKKRVADELPGVDDENLKLKKVEGLNSLPKRPSTAPASRSVTSQVSGMPSWSGSPRNNALGDGASDLGSTTSRTPLSSAAARNLIHTINRKLSDYVQEQRQHHEDAINKGEHLGADDEGRSQVDARSVGGVSTNLHLKSLVQERTALRRDGLMEKALELDAPIAQLQAEYRKERDERLTRVLENAKRRLQHQHQIRFRDLEAKHKQERMALDKQIDEGLERIREEHQVQTSNYIAEVMSKTGAKSDGEDDENKDTKPYLAKNQRHHIRTTTKPPEMVHQLKMAKHLRRKRRYAEAHDAERKARDIDLENTKTLCESVKKMATGTRLQNLVLQQETAVKLFQRRQASRLNNMYRRQEAAVTNLENLHRVEQSKVEKQLRAKFQTNIDFDNEDDDALLRATQRKTDRVPRPPSAPSRLKRNVRTKRVGSNLRF